MNSSPTNHPFVTVIMPIRNEADFIARSLGALLAQDYPADTLEILVADGQSDDDTRAIIEQLYAEYSQRCREAHQPRAKLQIIDNPARIVPTAMNLAIAQARGEIIVRVDGHTIIAPDYVTACVGLLHTSQADNVGGRMVAVSQSDFGRSVSLATSSPFGVGGSRFHYSQDEEWVDSVYMGAWPRSAFERYGVFDEEQVRNQDDEFNYRINAQGGRILLSPRIQSRYYNRSSWRGLWKQYFGYGFWKVRVMQKHPRQMKPRHFAPPIFAALWILVILAAPFSKAARRVLVAMIVGYGTANLAASAAALKSEEKVSEDQSGITAKTAMNLPLAFGILHFSYGLGFLVGLVKFARRWRD